MTCTSSGDKPLYTGSEWTMELIEKLWENIDAIAKDEFNYYEPQLEIISSEQMLDNYSSVAMPILYNHWSFGKTFIQNERNYKKGVSGLAYEVVINTNPCIAYLMENNTATLMALVLAHASVGHSHFFKNNYLFKNWTDADTIIDYLKFARNYIKDCEEKYGEREVELLLDACHSLQNHGVDKYKKPPKISKELQLQRQKKWHKYAESTFDDIWRTVPQREDTTKKADVGKFPEENLLYFIEKNSPILKPWQREIVRIVRKIAQYFYPQRQTSLLNEGFASFVHHYLMTKMHDQGLIDDGSYLEFLSSHSAVIYQPDWDSKYFSGINVYALGFAMLQDIKRMCIEPDEEDKKWFPDICNTEWLPTILDIIENYRDESFVLQFLSPKVARQFKLFSFAIDEDKNYLEVNATHDDESFLHIRKALSEQYDLSKYIPQIEVVDVDKQDRWVYLEHRTKDCQRLNYQNMIKTVEYFQYLWGFNVKMDYVDLEGNPLEKVR